MTEDYLPSASLARGDAMNDGDRTRMTPSIMLPDAAYVAGRSISSADGSMTTIIDPSTGNPLVTVPRCGVSDLEHAVRQARDAFDHGPWPKMPPSERAKILWRLADLIDRHSDELATIETLNVGKFRTRLPSRGIVGSAARICVHRPTMFAGRIVKMA